jgi:hypothetical protein
VGEKMISEERFNSYFKLKAKMGENDYPPCFMCLKPIKNWKENGGYMPNYSIWLHNDKCLLNFVKEINKETEPKKEVEKMKCNNCGHEKKKHYKLGKNHEGYCKEKDCTCNWFEQKLKKQ